MERKIFDVKDREIINMFWEDCNEPSFYKHVCQLENFLYLNGKSVTYPRVTEIVMNYIEVDDKNFDKSKRKLIENKRIFQFVYSNVYPEIHSFVEKIGVDMRNNFHLQFKEWKDRKKYSQKSIEGYFSKGQNSLPPVGAIQKKFVSDEDFEGKKIMEEQKQRKWKTKDNNRRRTDVKLQQKTRNLSE